MFPFLKIGVMWAICYSSGKILIWKEILIIIANEILNIFLNSLLKMRVGMEFGPNAFLEFMLPIIGSISSAVTASSKMWTMLNYKV